MHPADMVMIAVWFARSCGRFVYHHHMLEHEDMGMMYPFRIGARVSRGHRAPGAGTAEASEQSTGQL
jgi:hypothetical protein